MTSAVFMGTPQAAVPILGALHSVTEVRLCVTRPDRPRGRSKTPVPPPVKVAAAEWGIPVQQPSNGAALLRAMEQTGADVAVVAAYGRLIKPEVLAVPRLGFVNVHFSLLPRWRGASPVARAILAGDDVTGVALMVMDEGLDTGPVIEMAEMEIPSDATTGSLTMQLADLGAEMIRSTLPAYLAGTLEPMAQDAALATAAAKVETDEAFVDPERHSQAAVERAIRAFNPKPGAWAIVEGERMKLWAAEPYHGDGPAPGVAEGRSDGVLLGTRTGPIRLITVQPAGRPPMEARAWMNGRRGMAARFSR